MKDKTTSVSGWQPSPELEELVNAWCNGTIQAGEVAELEEILVGSLRARRYYRRVLNLHAGLHAHCEAQGEEGSLIDFPLPKKKGSWFGWAGWAAAAAFALTALSLQLRRPEVITVPGDSVAALPAANQVVGLMVNQSGAKFIGGQSEMPIRFSAGDYELESGIVHLRMTNGVDVVMRGPARFALHDAKLMTLDHGALRAIVPNSGKGFMVRSPEIVYEDLGTEFGVFVEDGNSEMHVFNGQVDVHQISSNQKVASVYNGESLVQKGDEISVGYAAPSVDFPLPEDVGFGGWQARQPSVIASEGLIGYFPFEYQTDYPDRLENVATGVPSERRIEDGRVVGARWVSGRWSEKDGLLFNRQGERVELELPGEYDELTFSVWAKVDHLENSLNAILTSTGWNEGDVHWQILRSHDPILAVHRIKESGCRLVKPIEPGRWQHLVAVVSKTDRRTRFYVDGYLAQENELPAETLVAPGTMWLGDWRQEAADRFIQRNFRGIIDELAIWDRALSEEEIREITRTGSPSILLLGKAPTVISSPRDAAGFPPPDVNISVDDY
ncbi:LamG-like jellyroll fold domain-containing protein [Roseibacillus ishigakijimensis]|uniref:FecR domain-containing protein n=1 Tax=Roseibacillus ishigakijimensis TaxID=454146 RepID=A0A934RNM0_9BACT|nr:LamG-like jellyroll fold domain-containing protein [Roseibacillus ishigakijimensis]MBK1832633.1 FecR domain-containing protein [Roseibacillus ishigakijimensis]